MSLTILPLDLLDRQEGERIGTRRRRSKNGVLTSSGLIDSGEIDSDYISLNLFNSISKLGYKLDTLHIDTVQTPFKNLPDIKCLGRCSLNIEIFNELTEVYETVSLNARVIDSPIDVIIGRPTIRKYKLLLKCHDQILDDTRVAHIENSPLKGAEFLENDLWLQLNLIASIAETESELKPDVSPLEGVASAPVVSRDTDASWNAVRHEQELSPRETTPAVLEHYDHILDDDTHPLREAQRQMKPIIDRLVVSDNPNTAPAVHALLGAIGRQRKQKANPEVAPLHNNVKQHQIFSKSDLLSHHDDGFSEADMINDPDDDPSYHTNTTPTAADSEYLDVPVHGTPEFQTQTRALLKQYRKVFSSTLPAQPARVTPLHLEVRESEWHKPSSQLPHRRQSTSKDVEINAQTRVMLDTRVISESDRAQAWSQVLLTLKPNGKWRFCIDFRQLNQLIKDRGWPLPRIDEVLERVGQQHSNFFGKMDLTSGYHQMPLDAESRRYTAFKTSNGLYEWQRVPMGLRNAAAHFQQCMATEVLNGLVGTSCELYLDDVLVHAQTEDEFLTRLKSICLLYTSDAADE